jgi:hypothetical protein
MPSSSQRRLLRWTSRIYRLMLLAYPRPFRRDYGREMTLVFDNQAQDVVQRNGTSALVPFMLYTTWDWLQSIVREGKDVQAHDVVKVNGVAVISLFAVNNITTLPDSSGQSRTVWLILTVVGGFLLVVGWSRWMNLMGIWR